METRLKERLRQTRTREFVGREAELAELMFALGNDVPVVILHGVAGVGKSTLLREFETHCVNRCVPTIRVDGREIVASPEGFRDAFEMRHAQVRSAGQIVLQIDNYEAIDALDRWFRDEFIPELPDRFLVVFAGRHSPASAWKTDPAWHGLFRAIHVKNLSRDESVRYLRSRNYDEEKIDDALEFTGGHPLALSLVSEIQTEKESVSLPAANSSDVIQTLIERFLEGSPDESHRRALEICSLARTTSESLIAAAIPGDDAFSLFRWLQDLSFVESGMFGIAPHELARKAIVADLRWRNPKRYSEARRAIRIYYREMLDRLSGNAQLAILFDYIYLHRENPVIAQAFEFDVETACYVDSLRPEDHASVVEMTLAHEGKDAAEIVQRWLEIVPDAFLMVRSSGGRRDSCIGFLQLLALDEPILRAATFDPSVRKIAEFMDANRPLRSGERGTLFRFWMDREQYQGVSPTQSLIFVQIVRHTLTTPRLAVTFIPTRRPEMWESIFTYADYERVIDADFEVGGERYGIYSHDLRQMPPLVWLDMLADREEALEATPTVKTTKGIHVFGREEFDSWVRCGLRDYLSAEKLKGNLLLKSRMVSEKVRTDTEEVRALRELLKEGALTMKGEANDQKLLRVLKACYFEPCNSQEEAAEKLAIGVATLRRHLKAALARLCDYLWSRETA